MPFVDAAITRIYVYLLDSINIPLQEESFSSFSLESVFSFPKESGNFSENISKIFLIRY